MGFTAICHVRAMKNFILMCLMGCVTLGLAAGYRMINPPPPADYEIVYFGSTNCGACHSWKRNDLPSWRQDPASASAPLHIADISGRQNPWNGAYGRHHDTFMEAFGKRRSISWPSFVLLNHGEVVRVKTGARGFQSIANEVRREHEREERRAAATS